jgi:tRNA A-37 threonylcarbamoyl transferase component Bud32
MTPMTDAQQQRVRDVFEAALDHPLHERSAWAAQQVTDDPVVRSEVLSLLEHDQRAGNFLTDSVLARVPDLLAEDDPLTPGTTIGTYTIVKELGRGGMGRVYLATDARLGRQVAIKALAPHLTRDPRHRERLRREARAAAVLTHPGICAVYALEEFENDLYIVTELIEGPTLRAEIASGQRPSSSEILRTAREIASALAEAHARGVVHRDLKPENIMRGRDGRLKILDFGLARFDAVSTPRGSGGFVTEPGIMIGTPAYMAPEQLNGEPADTRADVFAFGAVLYEYISGVHPFAAATPLATIARVLESDARPIGQHYPQVPAAVFECIERCLRKRPEDRFRTAGEIALALERADETVRPAAGHTWWRIHQLVIVLLYLLAASLGWQIKEWVKMPATVSLFIALGVGAAIAGVLRGHLVFTERINQRNFAAERRKAASALMIVDVLIAVALVADATMLAAWPLTAVLTMALGVGIAMAALVLEPATTRAVLGDG